MKEEKRWGSPTAIKNAAEVPTAQPCGHVMTDARRAYYGADIVRLLTRGRSALPDASVHAYECGAKVYVVLAGTEKSVVKESLSINTRQSSPHVGHMAGQHSCPHRFASARWN